MAEKTDAWPNPVGGTLGVVKSLAQWKRAVASFLEANELPTTAEIPLPPPRFPVFGLLLYVPPYRRVYASVLLPADALRLLKETQGFGVSGSGSDLRMETALVRLLIEGEVCTEERALAVVREVAGGQSKDLRALRRRLVRALNIEGPPEG